jgi:hypothetical protein
VPPRPLRELGKECFRRISAKKLNRPLEALTYMLALSKDRELRTQRQRAAELLRDEADVAPVQQAGESWRCCTTRSLM